MHLPIYLRLADEVIVMKLAKLNRSYFEGWSDLKKNPAQNCMTMRVQAKRLREILKPRSQ